MSKRYKIINGNLWDIEKNCMLFCSIKFSSQFKPYINADSVCKFLNLQNDITNAILKNNTKLKKKIDCLQKQLDCTNKNYNELSKRYYNFQNSNKLRTDEPLPDASLEKRLIDCEEYLKNMKLERDIYKNKYEKLSEKSKELFLHLKNVVDWYLGKSLGNTNINEIYLNKIQDCFDDVEMKLNGSVNNEKI